ncbi:hypothetical protein [Alkalicoccus daliensis]|uniref:Uncharacterized protein n=1 Tax=Alkalicoccus daliensis TaxID=745820 RepID=A0A1H0GH62_9BACI|nr:hypothetical protein [Alkalicoccus daliensis]SDO06188.1 hypothetical protein SAMN04488053_106106 [Alkalicoccus daliensis]
MFWNFNRKKEVLDATHVKCPSCEALTKVKEWNEMAEGTYRDVPDIRRAAVNRKNSFPFQCPECFKGYSAHKLTFQKETSGNPHIAPNTSESTN